MTYDLEERLVLAAEKLATSAAKIAAALALLAEKQQSAAGEGSK